MSRGEPRPIAVQPIINYPREAEVGQKYLMTIDLRPASVGDDWPYGDEEYAVYCMLDTEPLFSYEPLGEPAVVLHRFGGTYGSARFLLTAKRLGTKGSIRVTLVNGWGMPLYSLNLPGIQVMQEAARPLGKITAVEKPLPPSVDSHRNPFHLATIDQVERFYNRQSEVSYALDVLLQGGNVEVTGPRRIGKTWLLHYISHPTVLQEHGVDPQRSLFVYLDCQRHLGRQKEAQAYRTMSERAYYHFVKPFSVERRVGV